MVVAKIEEICSRDRIRVVRLPCGHITDKKNVGKRRHHYTNSRETLLITEQVAYDEEDLIL